MLHSAEAQLPTGGVHVCVCVHRHVSEACPCGGQPQIAGFLKLQGAPLSPHSVHSLTPPPTIYLAY